MVGAMLKEDTMARSYWIGAALLLLPVGCNSTPVEAPVAPVAPVEKVEAGAPVEASAQDPQPKAEASETEKVPTPTSPATAKTPESPPEKTQTQRIENVGFATPESVLFDPKSGGYFVSNINGAPLAKDDNGFISVLHHTGKVHELKWIDGGAKDVVLNAPKGMGIAHGRLYVADIDVVRMFDAKSAEPLGEIPIEGATFLNDIAVGPDETIYVSDSGLTAEFKASGTDAIYTINKANQVKTLIKDTSLGRPNGLLVAGGVVLVATFGTGEMYGVGPNGKRSPPNRIGKGQLDGMVRVNERDVLVSSWGSKSILLGKPGGIFKPIIEDLRAPADLGYDSKRNRVLIPLFQDDAVLIHQL
jgi:hypothetical protein